MQLNSNIFILQKFSVKTQIDAVILPNLLGGCNTQTTQINKYKIAEPNNRQRPYHHVENTASRPISVMKIRTLHK